MPSVSLPLVRSLVTVVGLVGLACEPLPEPLPMTLVVLEPPEYERRVVSDRPTPELVRETVKELAWKEITFVVLEADEANWLELSGSIDPSDGLSVRVMEEGRLLVIDDPPATLTVGYGMLQLYLLGDEGWREWSTFS